MAETSRRAAAPFARGGAPNAVFVVAAAEALPPELAGIADVVTVHLPWGSLLRGALALDAVAAAGIACLVAPRGRVEMLLAPAARDRLAAHIDVPARIEGSLAADWATLGLDLVEARPATADEIAQASTTWARRLGLGRPNGTTERVPYRIVLRRHR
jgi:16S rRNA (adenine(1408)-N(1))-methyltransferase